MPEEGTSRASSRWRPPVSAGLVTVLAALTSVALYLCYELKRNTGGISNGLAELQEQLSSQQSSHEELTNVVASIERQQRIDYQFIAEAIARLEAAVEQLRPVAGDSGQTEASRELVHATLPPFVTRDILNPEQRLEVGANDALLQTEENRVEHLKVFRRGETGELVAVELRADQRATAELLLEVSLELRQMELDTLHHAGETGQVELVGRDQVAPPGVASDGSPRTVGYLVGREGVMRADLSALLATDPEYGDLKGIRDECLATLGADTVELNSFQLPGVSGEE